MYVHLKTLGAILLIGSLALPMSTCSHLENSAGERVFKLNNNFKNEALKEVNSFNYALEDFSVTDPEAWLTLFVFTWPLLAIMALSKYRQGRVSIAIRFFEPLFLTGSIFFVIFLSNFFTTRMAVGAYVAFLALGIYGIGTFWNDIFLYMQWKQKKVSEQV